MEETYMHDRVMSESVCCSTLGCAENMLLVDLELELCMHGTCTAFMTMVVLLAEGARSLWACSCCSKVVWTASVGAPWVAAVVQLVHTLALATFVLCSLLIGFPLLHCWRV